MLGLTLEKLIIVAVVVGLLFGPERLVGLSQRFGAWVRTARDWSDRVQHRARAEFGDDVAQWTDLDPRRYDPRRIIRDALADQSTSESGRDAGTQILTTDAPKPIRRRRSDGHWEDIPTEAPTEMQPQ